MNKEDAIFIVGVFGIILYVCFTLSVLTTLGVVNVEVKKAIFKHYNVPLEGNK